jgi:hypothetical protein
MPTQLILARPDLDPRDQAIYAFLAEKHRRSESLRTVQSYSGMLRLFSRPPASPRTGSPARRCSDEPTESGLRASSPPLPWWAPASPA